MRVNLNQIAEKIVPNYSYEQFVDNVATLDLSPLYDGTLTTFYPTTITENKKFYKPKIRRYIFKYNSNGTYEFITTRKGQRNSGINVKIENSQINVIITDPEDDFSEIKNQNFTIINSNSFKAGNNIRIIKSNGRFLWQERTEGSAVFSTLYYSEPTSNPLQSADKENNVNWFQQTTNKYVVTNINRVVYYNNNTLAGLNSWPIQNENLSDLKPEMLDDAYLSKCFSNVSLNAYDIVFVEVLWKEYINKTKTKADYQVWLGDSFTVPAKKGRVYRVGKLAKSNGVGEYDVITVAQRTKIRTTKAKRGGNNVYN
jgi:hypothetical protein